MKASACTWRSWGKGSRWRSTYSLVTKVGAVSPAIPLAVSRNWRRAWGPRARCWRLSAMTSSTPEVMSGQGGESEDLYLLATLLEQLVEGQYDLWQQVAGRRELLRSALRQAMRAASISSDVASLLERCWDLLSDERTSLRVAEFYGRDPDYEQVTVDHERVLLGALRLAVTAQAAVAALQVGRVGDAA